MATPLFATTLATQTRHGVFAIERKPPPVIQAQGTGVVAIVGQFPWGPVGSVYEPADIGDALKHMGPPGFDHTGSAYLAMTGKAFPSLRLVRIVGASPVNAFKALVDAVPATICTVTSKYPGASGNSITWTIADASDAVAGHFKLTLSITGASGTTTEVVDNINFSGTGTDSTFDFTNSVLFGTLTKAISGRPVNGSGSLAGGTSSAIVAADYVGTAGTADKGMALLEGWPDVRHVVTDDPGNTIRAAVNAGLLAHVEFCGDRIGYTNGPSAQTAADARTNAATMQSKQLVYADPWVYVRDSVDGTKRLVPPGPFAASVASQLSPSTSMAWKDSEVRSMLKGIVDLEAFRGDSAGGNTTAGVCTLVKMTSGGFAFESAVVTNYPVDATTGNLTRTRMAIYIVKAMVNSLGTFVDAPNVLANQEPIKMAVEDFLGGLKAAANSDPNHTPHIKDYAVAPISASNTDADVQAGNFTVAADVQTSAAMSRIGLSVSIGESVKIASTL